MNVLIWYRHDLRLTEHPALQAGVAMTARLAPFYLADPEEWADGDRSGRQWELRAEALAELRQNLALKGASLVVRLGPALVLLPRFCKQHDISQIISITQSQSAHQAVRDQALAAVLRQEGITWQQIPATGAATGKARKPSIEPELPAQITMIPGLTPGPIPRAQGLGLALDPCPHRPLGGETAAQLLLDRLLRQLEKNQNNPEPAQHKPTTTPLLRHTAGLSVPLSYGALSARQIRTKLSERGLLQPSAWRQAERLRETAPPSTTIARANTAPSTVLQALEAGETGQPFIDACLRHLAAFGWIGGAQRTLILRFCLGPMGLELEEAQNFLARRLLDYDPALHHAHCQRIAALPKVGFDPIKAALQMDPSGQFTRHWLPSLAALPQAVLQMPWRWDGARALLGRRYPEPLFNQRERISPSPSWPPSANSPNGQLAFSL